jgi:putative endonuclease
VTYKNINNTKSVGKLGEELAEKFLKNKGYKIIERNYIPKKVSGPLRGEIDIIAEKDGVIIFVEVKTLLNSGNIFLPEDKVDFKKRKKLIKIAENWLLEKRKSFDVPWQIEIVGINIDSKLKKAKIRHFIY